MIKLDVCNVVSICRLPEKNAAELGYNVKKVTEYFMLL
jgi:hypothetical protein